MKLYRSIDQYVTEPSCSWYECRAADFQLQLTRETTHSFAKFEIRLFLTMRILLVWKRLELINQSA